MTDERQAHSDPRASTSWPQDGPVRLCILHAARSYIVIDKPAGMLSVPGRGEDKRDSATTRVAEVYTEATGPLNVHRLDMETSGLMVFALNRQSHRALSRQFMNRKVSKSYIALVDGIIEPDEGRIDLPLIADWPNRPLQKIDREIGRPALTLYRVIERDHARRRSRVEFRPATGRTHQLRLHAAAPRAEGGLGCPILGDSLYGDASSASRLMLHASLLAFWDPDLGEWRKFECPAPF